MRVLVTLTFAAALAASSAAIAQQSLFDQPASNEPAPAATAAKPKTKPKPRGPVPTRTLQITNAGTGTVAALEVSGEGKTARIAKPIPPGGKITLKLPAMKGCTATVTATLADAAEPDTSEHDLCKDKSIRFTD